MATQAELLERLDKIKSGAGSARSNVAMEELEGKFEAKLKE